MDEGNAVKYLKSEQSLIAITFACLWAKKN